MIKKKYDVQKVLKFLEDNPNFFVKNPDLLKNLVFPDENNNEMTNVVSFKDWIIKNLKDKQKKILKNAKYNYITQNKVYEVILTLMEIDNFKSLVEFINKKLADELLVDCIVFASSSKKILKYGVTYIDEKILDSIFSDNQFLLMDAVDDRLKIFSSKQTKIYSNAIYLFKKKYFGSSLIIAFGSNEKMFIGDKGSELIIFFSRVFESRCMQLIKNENKNFNK